MTEKHDLREAELCFGGNQWEDIENERDTLRATVAEQAARIEAMDLAFGKDRAELEDKIDEQAARDEALTARVAGLLTERVHIEAREREQAAEIERLKETIRQEVAWKVDANLRAEQAEAVIERVREAWRNKTDSWTDLHDAIKRILASLDSAEPTSEGCDDE